MNGRRWKKIILMNEETGSRQSEWGIIYFFENKILSLNENQMATPCLFVCFCRSSCCAGMVGCIKIYQQKVLQVDHCILFYEYLLSLEAKRLCTVKRRIICALEI